MSIWLLPCVGGAECTSKQLTVCHQFPLWYLSLQLLNVMMFAGPLAGCTCYHTLPSYNIVPLPRWLACPFCTVTSSHTCVSLPWGSITGLLRSPWNFTARDFFFLCLLTLALLSPLYSPLPRQSLFPALASPLSTWQASSSVLPIRVEDGAGVSAPWSCPSTAPWWLHCPASATTSTTGKVRHQSSKCHLKAAVGTRGKLNPVLRRPAGSGSTKAYFDHAPHEPVWFNRTQWRQPRVSRLHAAVVTQSHFHLN